MRKAGIFSVLSLIGIIALSTASATDAPRYVIPMQSNKVVMINNRGGHCSGFVASPHVIITAAHCVEGGKPFLESGEPLNVLYQGVEGTYQDFAILWVAKERKEWLKLRASEPEMLDPLMQVSRNPETFAMGLSFAGTYVDGSFLVRGRVRPGDSGSAVMDADNYVIGITYAYIASSGEIGILAPIKGVIEKLQELKVEPPPQPWGN